MDTEGRTGIDFGVYGVPETFIIGPDGTIRDKLVGILTPESYPGVLDKIRSVGRAASAAALTRPAEAQRLARIRRRYSVSGTP